MILKTVYKSNIIMKWKPGCFIYKSIFFSGMRSFVSKANKKTGDMLFLEHTPVWFVFNFSLLICFQFAFYNTNLSIFCNLHSSQKNIFSAKQHPKTYWKAVKIISLKTVAAAYLSGHSVLFIKKIPKTHNIFGMLFSDK